VGVDLWSRRDAEALCEHPWNAVQTFMDEMISTFDADIPCSVVQAPMIRGTFGALE
jgi:hypothetical protein